MARKPANPKPPKPRKAFVRGPDAAPLCEAFGEDAMLDRIEAGAWPHEIASAIGISPRAFGRWVAADPARQARFSEAWKDSAASCDRQAEEAILALPANATQAQVQQMRELVQHKRWQAKMRNRMVYGDQATITVREDVPR